MGYSIEHLASLQKPATAEREPAKKLCNEESPGLHYTTAKKIIDNVWLSHSLLCGSSLSGILR
jgi:hypothetical protein